MRAKLIPLLLLPLFANAEPKLSAYQELCSYDAFCSRLRNSDGSKVQPKPAVKKLIETMADPVHDFAKLYQVDPRAVAGAILAENSMNVQMDDEIQNWIVKNNIWGSKAALKAGMSIGPGQINIGPAIAADQYIASLGLRPARSEEEITKLLLTPAGAAEYSAAIMRQAQDAYKEAGIDISNRPDLLVTLYNIGERGMPFVERAKEMKKLKQEPRPNFFGMFVAENIDSVENAIGWSPEKGRYKKENTELYAAGAVNMVDEDFTLQTAPPSCSTEGAGDLGQWRARQTWEPFQTFTPRRTRFLEIVGRSVDCQMREWLQLKTTSGELGWMPKASLGSVSTPLPQWRLAVSACGTQEKENCLQKSLGLYGQPKLDGRDDKGKYFLSVKKNDPNDPVAPNIRPTTIAAAYGGECETKYPELKKQLEAIIKQGERKNKAVSRADLYDLKAKLSSKQEELKAFLGVKDEFEEKQVYDESADSEEDNGGAGANNPPQNQPNNGQTNPYGQSNSQPNSYGQGFAMGGMMPGFNSAKLKTVKVKKPSKDPYMRTLEYVEKGINTCLGEEKADCQIYGNEEDFKKFLEADLSKIRSLSDFKKLMKFEFGLNRVERQDKEAQNEREKEQQKALEELKKKRDIMARSAREACAYVKDSLPSLYQKTMAAIDDLEKLDDSRIFSYVLPAFERTCEQAWLLEEFKGNGNKLLDGSKEFNCAYRKEAEIEKFSLDFLAKMGLTSDDYSEMLKFHFEEVEGAKKRAAQPQTRLGSIARSLNALSSSTQNYIDELKQNMAACNYNALATAKAVEELAKSPCVDSILVKDMTLSKGLGGNAKARVVLDNSLDAAQIAFTMKNDCRMELLGRPKGQPASATEEGSKE